MSIKYLKPTTLKNKTVLVRGSVDAPVDGKTGKVEDDFRIKSFLPTLEFLLHGKNKIIICGKRGRPNGTPDKDMSLKPVAEQLANLLHIKFVESDSKVPDYQIPHVVFFSGDIREEKNRLVVQKAGSHNIIFLENLEFYAEELSNDSSFAKKIASMADVYVDDDFSKVHHPVASNVAITKYLPSFCGPLLEAEIKNLGAVEKGKHPFVVMMGGIKISDKVKTLEKLGERADKILIGGGLSSLFFAAKGFDMGISKMETEAIKTAWQLEKTYKDKLVLPVDVVVANKDMEKNSIRVVTPYDVGKKEMILDCGPKTILAYAHELKQAKTIIWNGPLGHFEVKPFHTATIALARIIGSVGKRKAFAVVGGGETVDAIRQSGQFEHIDHVSTGGGAMLELLAGKKLPGIGALDQ